MTSVDICGELVPKYLNSLSIDFETAHTDAGCFIVTPFIRPDGEAIELEVETLSSRNVRISDMGDTFGYLFINGLTLSRTMMDRAKHISMSHGVSLKSATLSVEADIESAGIAVHRLIQATLAVTDLIQMRRHTSTQKIRFDNEVESLVIYSGVTYDTEYSVKGQHETHKFRFHVNSGKGLLIQPLTASTEATAHAWAERWAYRFGDVTQLQDSWRPFAVLDNRRARPIWTTNAVAPIQEHAILWTERDRLSDLLLKDMDEARGGK